MRDSLWPALAMLGPTLAAYAPGSQQSSMPTPSAAASLVPMLGTPETETLAERLKRPPAAAPADDDEY